MKRNFASILFLLFSSSAFLLSGCNIFRWANTSSGDSSTSEPSYHLYTDEMVIDVEKEHEYALDIKTDAPFDIPLYYQPSDFNLYVSEDGVINCYDPGVYRVLVTSPYALNSLDIQVNVINPELTYEGDRLIELKVGETFGLNYGIEYIGANPSRNDWFDESRVKANVREWQEFISVDDDLTLTALSEGFTTFDLFIADGHSQPIFFDTNVLSLPYVHDLENEKGVFAGDVFSLGLNGYDSSEPAPVPFSNDEEIVSCLEYSGGSAVGFKAQKEGVATVGYLYGETTHSYTVYVYDPARFVISGDTLVKAVDLNGLETLHLPLSYQGTVISIIKTNAFVGSMGQINTFVLPSSIKEVQQRAFYQVNGDTGGERHVDMIVPTISVFDDEAFRSSFSLKVYTRDPEGRYSTPAWKGYVDDLFYGFDGLIGQDGNGFVYYRSGDNEATLSAFLSMEANVAIPSVVPGVGVDLPVKHLVPYFGSGKGEGSLVLPSSLEVVDGLAFYSTDAQEIIVPEGVQTIEGAAFSNSSLERLFLPSSLKEIYGDPFENCPNLIVFYPEGDGDFKSLLTPSSTLQPGYQFGLIYDYAGKTGKDGSGFTFALCSDENGDEFLTVMDYEPSDSYDAVDELVVPSSATLEGVVYPVRRIGQRAFEYLENVGNLVLEEGIVEIDSYAFYETGLGAIEFPSTLTTLKDYAFGSASFREGSVLVIPDHIADIGEFAFCGLDPFMENFAVFFEDETVADSLRFDWYVPRASGYVDHGVSEDGLRYGILRKNDNLWAYVYGAGRDTPLPENLVLDSITHEGTSVPIEGIGPQAFMGNKTLVSVILGDGVSFIEGNAFSDCPNLKKVRLSDALTRIEDGLFVNCSSLEEVEIPSEDFHSVNYLGSFAFYGTSLRHFSVPTGVREIGEHCFAYCPNLQSVYFVELVSYIGGYAFVGSPFVEVYTRAQSQGIDWESTWAEGLDASRIHYRVTYNEYLAAVGLA